jgi:hypothetical protein
MMMFADPPIWVQAFMWLVVAPISGVFVIWATMNVYDSVHHKEPKECDMEKEGRRYAEQTAMLDIALEPLSRSTAYKRMREHAMRLEARLRELEAQIVRKEEE